MKRSGRKGSYRINVLFKDGSDYQCDWQLNLLKMYAFIANINHHRGDMRRWVIECGDGSIVDSGSMEHGPLRFKDKKMHEFVFAVQ